MTAEACRICDKVPAGITSIHAQFRRPLIDIRKGVSLPLLFFQNNNQDCMLCDLSSGQREFDPLDVRQTRRQRLYCHPSEWKPTCSLCVLHRSNFCFLLGRKVTNLFQILLNKLLFMLHRRSQQQFSCNRKNATANTKADVLCLSVPENTGITQAITIIYVSWFKRKPFHFTQSPNAPQNNEHSQKKCSKFFLTQFLKSHLFQKGFI